MTKNQGLAVELNRPSCQDTGVLQFWLKCGTNFPYINELEGLLKEAVVQATFAAPLRHNSVETFDEYNTKKNVGKGTPTVWWDIVPNSDKCEIYAYMAGGGCTLPGKAMVLMPGAGYEGVTDFVLDQMTSYGLNACPPLLVGVGVGTSVETAALNSKKALMRPIGSHNDNANAAKMEKLLEDGINAIGLGPQGMGGKYSVMGVNIENTARHPSAIGVAVNVGCWSHRRLVEYGRELPYDIRNKAIFHAGPIVRKIEGTEDDYEMVSVGPTTSMRMEKFEYEFTKLTGVRVIVGKGGMGPNTERACKEFGAIHCVFPAGCAVVAATEVEKIAEHHWDELGMPETLWCSKVKEFGPLIVSIDAQGRNLFEENKVIFNQRKEAAKQAIYPEVKFIK